MTATATYPATMPDIKTDPGAAPGMWSPYPSATSAPPTTARFHGIMEPSPTSPHPQSHLARPRSSHHHNQVAAAAAAAAAATGAPDQHSYHPPSYSRYSHDESDGGYDQRPSGHPVLTPQSSFPSLKRTFSQTEPSGADYAEMRSGPGLGMGDDGSKLSAGHDHKLLSFKKTADKHTILDSRGRIQQLDMSAQLHGMFFLSEMPPASSENSGQPELTCYRRNLFQISGSLIVPRGQLSVVLGDTGETVPVATTEVTISAIESVDGNGVRLIVIPWKTPPPNTPELSTGPDAEPVTLPLIPFSEENSEADGEYAVYPIGWRRLQFRVATANNGRRKELQQHFILHLKVVGTLGNGNKVVLSESTTSPIVVRGRSPRNFQARKEIPLLGSSAGSRGQALVETGLGIVAGPLTAKPTDKLRGVDNNMQVPRSAFTFSSAPKLPGSQMPAMRSNSYPAGFSPQGHMPMSQLPVSGPPSYPPSTLASDSPYPKLPLSGNAGYSNEPHDMSLQGQMPLPIASNDGGHSSIRAQYAYAPPSGPAPLATSDAALSVPRYVDNNPRPTKSPRNLTHDSVHSASAVSNDSPSEYRYSSYPPISAGGAGEHGSHGTGGHGSHGPQTPYGAEATGPQSAVQTPREYYPSHSSTWGTSASSESPSTLAPYPGHPHPHPHHEGRSYTFPNAGYKAAAAPHGSATPTASGPPKADHHPGHHHQHQQHHQQQPQAVYSTGPHSAYDGMYWNGN
jgi:hypothetical protein